MLLSNAFTFHLFSFELYAFELSVNYKCLNFVAFEPFTLDLYVVSRFVFERSSVELYAFEVTDTHYKCSVSKFPSPGNHDHFFLVLF